MSKHGCVSVALFDDEFDRSVVRAVVRVVDQRCGAAMVVLDDGGLALPNTNRPVRQRGRRPRPPAQRCPACRQELRLQGGYERLLRHAGRRYRVWIWRAYCRPCDASHALLPDFVVAHHLDSTDTIYAAVTHNSPLEVPASTRRGWRARFRRNERLLVSGSAATTIALVGEVTLMGTLDDTLVRLWLAARRRTDMLPPRSRILNIISGSTWIRERVDSSWLIVGVYPRPP